MAGSMLEERTTISRPSDQYPHSDGRLVDRFRSGDEAAFDDIVRRYQERVYQFVCRVVGDAEDAADVTQETFIRAYDKLNRFRGDSGLYTWLYRIAMNMSINCLRERKLRTFVGLDDPAVPELRAQGGPEEDVAARELRGHIDAAIAKLPPRQRSIFVLRHFDELSHRDIALVVGSSEGAVRSGYFHALRKLRSALQDPE